MARTTQRQLLAATLVLGLAAALALALGAWPASVHAQEEWSPRSAGDVSASDWEWVIETVDSEGDVGEGASLALDGSNVPHIAYHDGTTDRLKYAVLGGSGWVREVVAENAAPNLSLALDASGVPHIGYTIREPAVGYATFDGTEWVTETVDGPASAPSIAVHSAGNPHMAYCGVGPQTGLKYAHWSEEHGWTIETVTTEACSAPSLALDSSGTPHIAFQDVSTEDLRYAVWSGTAWDIGTVTEDVVPPISLALDDSDTPHVAYVVSQDGPEATYAVLDGSTWIVETVEGWAATPSLAVHEGTPYMGSSDPRPLPPAGPGRGLLFTHRAPEGWMGSSSVAEIACDSVSLDVSSEEFPRPYIAFRDIEEGDLKLASLQFVPDYDLRMNVNYGHNWVEGEYEPGYTVGLTLTNSVGDVKATASGETGPIPWWGEGNGFSTNHNAPWVGEQPDIQAGDWVYGVMSNGYTSTVQVGEITGALDIDADTISGTIHAPWFSEPLDARCGVWEMGGPEASFTVEPDGGAYFCDFGALEWDLLPGQMVGVQYQDPDGNAVINVFEEAVPHLRIDKWADGEPAAGGGLSFGIRYCNHSTATAEGVVITDTMAGMSYQSDTSDFTKSGSGSAGDPLVWDVGTIEGEQCGEFEVFVDVTAAAGQTASNVAEIACPLDEGEPGEKRSEWEGQVQANDTFLDVNKWSWTWGPAAGGEVVFEVNICNTGSTGSSAVFVTDTLQAPLSVQNWWSYSSGWQEVSRGDQQLVLSRPTLNARQCHTVYVLATVDPEAQPGDPLSNTAIISSANDLSLDDNETTWEGEVGEPRTNLGISQHWGHGQITPGGQLNYWIHVQNDGNTSVAGAIRITDTLPASTSLHGVLRQDPSGQYPVTPVETAAGYTVWEIDGLGSGFTEQFMVTLDVEAGATPGTELLNTVEISPQPGEETYDDNISAWSETLNPLGPNLRVRKSGQWDDGGENTHRASYMVSIENVGSDAISPVVFTDTYPAGMGLDGGIQVAFWENWEWEDHGDHLSVTVERLEPGWNTSVNLSTIADSAPLPFGLTFTNTAAVMLPPGDTNPGDNSDSVVLTTGPDLYVQKALVAGEPRPGEMVTFALAFGNDREGHEWWWGLQGNAVLTDTLPAGTEYVSALQHWCGPEGEWCERAPDAQEGGQLTWNVGALGPAYSNEIHLTVRILEDTEPGLYVNTAEIVSDQPEVDLEPRYDNNGAAMEIEVLPALYDIYMPMVMK